MSDIDLTLAMAYYEHVADLTSGRVRVEGVSLRWLELPVEEIFHRFIQFREWHVSEMSMGKYVSVIAEGDDSMVGLPVFPSRVFRHSAIYVRAGEMTEPAQLRGKRIGVPEWAQTAAVYGRALLSREWGVPLPEVDWYQAGVNQAGRIEHVDLRLPPGIRLTAVPGRSLNDMLLDGSVDAVLSAHPPESFKAGDPRVRRLIADHVRAEEEYAARTGIVPIMHVVVVRRDVVDQYPWLPGNLMTGFAEARTRSIARLAAEPAGPGSRVPLLWTHDALARTRAAFGGEPWPYGVEANRTTLDAFTRWAYEQGVTRRRVDVDELFPASVRSTYRILCAYGRRFDCGFGCYVDKDHLAWFVIDVIGGLGACHPKVPLRGNGNGEQPPGQAVPRSARRGAGRRQVGQFGFVYGVHRRVHARLG